MEKTSLHSIEAAFGVHDSAFRLVVDSWDVFVLTSSVDKAEGTLRGRVSLHQVWLTVRTAVCAASPPVSREQLLADCLAAEPWPAVWRDFGDGAAQRNEEGTNTEGTEYSASNPAALFRCLSEPGF